MGIRDVRGGGRIIKRAVREGQRSTDMMYQSSRVLTLLLFEHIHNNVSFVDAVS